MSRPIEPIIAVAVLLARKFAVGVEFMACIVVAAKGKKSLQMRFSKEEANLRLHHSCRCGKIDVRRRTKIYAIRYALPWASAGAQSERP